MPPLGPIPPGAMGSKGLSHICSGLSKQAKALVEAVLEPCYSPLSPLENGSTCEAFPTGPPVGTSKTITSAEWVWTFNGLRMCEMVIHYGK